MERADPARHSIGSEFLNMKSCALALLAVSLLCSCGAVFAQGPLTLANTGGQTIYPGAPLSEATARDLMGTKQLTVTVTLYSSPTGITTVGGSRFMVIMVSSDFVGTIQGCTYTGSGTSFQDAFQAIAPPGNYTIGPVTVACTAGSYRVLDLR